MKQFLYFITLLLPFALSAQIVNIENYRFGIDSNRRITSTIDGNFELIKKNVRSAKLSSRFQSVYQTKQHAYILIGKLNVSRVESNNFLEEGFVHLRAHLFRKDKWAIEAFTQYQYDLGKNLAERELLGGNIRLPIIKDSIISIIFGIGSFLENEIWNTNDGFQKHNLYLKSNNYLSVRLLPFKNSSFFVTSYYQAKYNQFNHPRIIVDTNWQIAFNKKLSYNIKYSFIYDRSPIIPSADLVYTFSTGLLYNF